MDAGNARRRPAAARWLEDAGIEVEQFRPTGLEAVRELWDIFGRASWLLLEPLKGAERRGRIPS